MRGKVFLVGAGPGPADLLTLRAVRVLQNADVVLHDALVSREFLEFVPAAATVLDVGKRCHQAGTPQPTLNQLMIEFARAGKRVVRLKCGDPAIFGRLGEEMDALRDAGIEFEIVPGITAALAAAAAAQISLTKRRLAHRLVFATATLAGERRQRWDEIVLPNTTVVVYMPGPDYHALAAELLAAGIGAELPCAIVSRAGGRDEAVTITTVGELQESPAAPAPAVLLIGEVVADAQVSLSRDVSFLQEVIATAS